MADKDEIRPQYQDSTVDGSAVFTSSLVRNLGPQFGVGSTIDALDNIEVNSVGALNELATPWYSDQILPFDVTLAGANEYGAMAAAKIFGIEILNEGTGHSIDDAVSEMQATFVARAIEPMQAVPSAFDGLARLGLFIPATTKQSRTRAKRRPSLRTQLGLHLRNAINVRCAMLLHAGRCAPE